MRSAERSIQAPSLSIDMPAETRSSPPSLFGLGIADPDRLRPLDQHHRRDQRPVEAERRLQPALGPCPDDRGSCAAVSPLALRLDGHRRQRPGDLARARGRCVRARSSRRAGPSRARRVRWQTPRSASSWTSIGRAGSSGTSRMRQHDLADIADGPRARSCRRLGARPEDLRPRADCASPTSRRPAARRPRRGCANRSSSRRPASGAAPPCARRRARPCPGSRCAGQEGLARRDDRLRASAADAGRGRRRRQSAAAPRGLFISMMRGHSRRHRQRSSPVAHS